ncbi:unnamed protein product [Cyprideis torosa]|uniref:Coronin n=1 Tax=Cyprideis torosa TaxID=163714 RepID=A0A7R8W789_9CRUS|nr:unnamed protein product [Cyprideis torosa]CAG0887327.1 unnamed protein product [Cyprideis torosa]
MRRPKKQKSAGGFFVPAVRKVMWEVGVVVDRAGGEELVEEGTTAERNTGRVAPDHPLVGGHKGPVLDIEWCPHNDNVIASGSEDCTAKVWQIPDLGLIRTLTDRDAVVELAFHQRRVGLVTWHPSAQNILLTAGGDNLIAIWNVGRGEVLLSIDCHPDMIYSSSWNYNGSQIVTTCRDKKIRIIDVRTGNVEEEASSHEGGKATRAIFLANGLVFTTGFNKGSERQYSLRAPEHLHNPICMVELDTSNGLLFPFYDPDTNMIYLCGKGDSVMRYFEITKEPPFVHYIATHQASDPQRGIGNYGRFTRSYWTWGYGNRCGDGQDASSPPGLCFGTGDFQATTQKDALRVSKQKPKSNALDRQPAGRSHSSSASSAARGDAVDGEGASSREIQELKDALKKATSEMKKMGEEIKRLKSVAVKHENRIRELEAKAVEELSDDESPPPDENQATPRRKGGGPHSNNGTDTSPDAFYTPAPNPRRTSQSENFAPDEV